MASPEEQVRVRSISIEPNQCPLANELNIVTNFTLNTALAEPRWKIEFIVDASSKRHVVELGSIAPSKPYECGENTLEFHVDRVDVSSVKRKHMLLNVGLFTLTLFDADSEVVAIKIVTQVSKDADGVLQRVMFNPLEE